MRVIDTAKGQHCVKGETALGWAAPSEVGVADVYQSTSYDYPVSAGPTLLHFDSAVSVSPSMDFNAAAGTVKVTNAGYYEITLDMQGSSGVKGAVLSLGPPANPQPIGPAVTLWSSEGTTSVTRVAYLPAGSTLYVLATSYFSNGGTVGAGSGLTIAQVR